MVENTEVISKHEPRRTNLKEMSNDPVGFFLSKFAKDIQPSKNDLSFLSPNQKAEALWALFERAKGLVSGRLPKPQNKNISDEVGLSFLLRLYKDDEARNIYLTNNKKHLLQSESLNSDWEKYRANKYQLKAAQDAFDAAARYNFSLRNQGMDEFGHILLTTAQEQAQKNQQALTDLMNQNPELVGLIQYETLQKYGQEFRKTKFIWFPSRMRLLEEIESKALASRPLLFVGESGTGKTTLLERSALILTGQLLKRVSGRDELRINPLIAERGFGEEEDFYRYKALGNAVTGKEKDIDKKTVHDGAVFAVDEFNLLSQDTQSSFMSDVAGWKQGEEIELPVVDKVITVAPNFLFAALVNIGPRYRRNVIPVEVLRKFSSIDVNYLLQTTAEPEIYEGMLAALMDENDRIRVSKEELSPYYEYREEVKTVSKDNQEIKQIIQIRELKNERQEGAVMVPAGGFLWRFANALNELNKSFQGPDAGGQTVLNHKGEAQYLQSLVVDFGKILEWLHAYRAFDYAGKSLETFMVEKLDNEYLSKTAYSKEDRELVKEFLRYFGIETNLAKVKKEAPPFEIMTPLEMGLLSPRVRYERVVGEEPVVIEGYFINSEGGRVVYDITSYEEGDKKLTVGQIMEDKTTNTLYEFRGVVKDTGEPVFFPYQQKIQQRVKPPITPPESHHSQVTIEAARILLGQNFLGPEAIKNTFGIELRSDEIPPIPFSYEELKQAQSKEQNPEGLNQALILFVDKTKDGLPLSMKKMNEMLKDRFVKEGKGKILYDTNWYKNQAFFTTETARAPEDQYAFWGLLTIDHIPHSTSKNHLQQTQLLAEYLQKQVFAGASLPDDYQKAIEELSAKQAEIQSLLATNWEKAADMLAGFAINRLRPTPAEFLYAFIMFLDNYGRRLLVEGHTWSTVRSSGRGLVVLGCGGVGGVRVDGWRPGGSRVSRGCSLLRSH